MSNMCWHAFEQRLKKEKIEENQKNKENKTLAERNRKEQNNTWISESQVVTLLPAVALRSPLASLSIQVSIFF